MALVKLMDVALAAIFGPATAEGSENVDMSGQSPWKDLRRERLNQ